MNHSILSAGTRGSRAHVPAVNMVPVKRLPAILAMSLVLSLGWGLLTQTYADVIPVTEPLGGGAGTLAWAINQANTLPNPPHTVVFDTSGTIIPNAPLPAIQVDGTEIRGEQNSAGDPCPGCDPRVTVQGTLTTGVPGIVIQANDCIITGLEIRDFDHAGIEIAPGYKRNQIGEPGPECCERVWLTENGVGVRITSLGTDDNLVRNSRIYSNELDGVQILSGPRYNWIGVDADGERNYIYSNGRDGVLIATELNDVFATTELDTVAGNYIYDNAQHGVHFQGLGNGYDVIHCGVIENQIGIDEGGIEAGNDVDGVALHGSSPFNWLSGNLIVNNGSNGIGLGELSDNNSVATNHIGVTESGQDMGNGGHGICIETDSNLIGPDNTVMHNGSIVSFYAGLQLENGADHNEAWSNVFSLNIGYGVNLTGSGTSYNDLYGNYIGTDNSVSVIGNMLDGIRLQDNAGGNYIHENIIGCNDDAGIAIRTTAGNNAVYANRIGTDTNCEYDLGNGGAGISLRSSNNTIGGTGDWDGNVICHNGGWGIHATAATSQQGGNQILGNWIGMFLADEDHHGNAYGGIFFGEGMVDNDVGHLPTTLGAKNILRYNDGPGILVGQQFIMSVVPVMNRFRTNQICDNADGSVANQIQLVYGGNDDLPPPEVVSAQSNLITFPDGDHICRVSGNIGYTHPPPTATEIQVFYDDGDDCCNFLGQTMVPIMGTSWTVDGDPLAIGAHVYATETTKGPDDPPEPKRQTSPFSDEIELTWFFDLADHCSTLACPWLGTDDIGSSVSWVDYNNDDLLDMFICNMGSANLLLRNLGEFNFDLPDSEWLGLSQADTRAAAWGDFDDDGFVDVYIVNDGQANMLFRNTGGSGFEDLWLGLEDEGHGRGASWVDVDLDGDLDLFLVNYMGSNRLWRNNGDLSFTDVTPEEFGSTSQPNNEEDFGDFDGDGDPDLYIVNDGEANQLFRNDGGFEFTDVTSGPLGDAGQGTAAAWVDFNNDTHLDLFVANHDGGSKLLHGAGDGTFTDATPPEISSITNITGVSTEDVDLNGLTDVVLFFDLGEQVPVTLFNYGGAGFVPREGPTPDNESIAGAMADLDDDGDLDVFTVSPMAGQDNGLFLNAQVEGNHWLKVELMGVESNRFGVGARIEVMTGRATQTREVRATTSGRGQNDVTAEFGLGEFDTIESLRVLWPSGRVTELFDVGVDTLLYIEEIPGSSVDPTPAVVATRILSGTPNPFYGTTRVDFQLLREESVSLRIFDAAGRLVRILADGVYGAGVHHKIWNGRNQTNEPVGNGVYFLSLETARERHRQKLMLIR